MDETPRSDMPPTPTGRAGEKDRTGARATGGPTTTGGPKTTGAAKTGRKGAPWGLLVVLVVLAFAGGFLWQFYEASTVRDQLTAAEQELALERLRVHLGQAALAAQAGNYEPARRQMSTFFTQLQEEAPAMPPQVQSLAQDFLSMRDEVITGLSRSNPEYAGVLYGMLEQFGNTLDGLRPGGADGGMPTGGPDGGAATPVDTGG